MLVEEDRVQRQGSGGALKVIRFQDTILVLITHRKAVGQILYSATQADVIVCAYRGLINLILPVGIGRPHRGDLRRGAIGGDDGTELGCAEYRHFFYERGEGIVGMQVYFERTTPAFF